MTDRIDRRSGEYHVVHMFSAMLLIASFSVPANAADANSQAKMQLGREVFTKLAAPNCGICHALKDAGTTGEIGAKLEELKPTASQVAEAVRKGVGAMPPFEGKLTEAQIQAVAYYVSQAARKGN